MSSATSSSTRRCLRLMRQAGLLAPGRPLRELGPRTHEGTIVTSKPDEMWGTDATVVWTREKSRVTIFVALDHCTQKAVGIHTAKVGNRFEAFLQRLHGTLVG